MVDADKGAKPVSKASISAVCNIIGLVPVSIKKRSSVSGGAHWIVEVDRDMTPVEIIAVQMAMGDDIRRGTLNLARVMNGAKSGDPYNLLFDSKLTTKGVLNGNKKKNRVG